MSVGGSIIRTGLGAEGSIIELTRGLVSRVDAADALWLSSHNWCAHRSSADVYYAGRSIHAGHRKTKTFLMHREIMKAEPGQFVDHINGDKLDNRRSNLRICTREQNRWNTGPRPGSSRFKGVSRHPKNKVWVAQITFLGKNRYLGSFQAESDAARAYDAAAVESYGEFAHLNFPEGASI